MAEAAFQAIAKAAEVIDMREHRGEHPRLGATDVCPFVPVEGVTLEECAEIARKVGRRVGDELGIPVYFYEAAATDPSRKNLADVRRGEYEGLAEKLGDGYWQPDCGPAILNPRSGATIIGAREFLIAYNITLEHPRQVGGRRYRLRAARAGAGRPAHDRLRPTTRGRAAGLPRESLSLRQLRLCRSDAWKTRSNTAERRTAMSFASWPPTRFRVIRRSSARMSAAPASSSSARRSAGMSRSMAGPQISMNLTNYHVTPPHVVLERARQLAAERGLAVTGSEIVGMIPYAALLEAGKYYLAQQGRSTDIPAAADLETAVDAMGLRDVRPFDVQEKVIGLP